MSNSRRDDLAMRGGEPDPPPNQAFQFGMLSILTTTFVGLVGHGYHPRDALVTAIIVCAGGAEIIRRFPGGGNGERGGPRWA
ncbi:hypothetical protein [Streptosporangium sp. NPDC000509]|uniref:hypothetical protein n=1 Tax=Streptosporangium sp. NPDC000509 TaxID=3366186 RepID=UPI00369010FF